MCLALSLRESGHPGLKLLPRILLRVNHELAATTVDGDDGTVRNCQYGRACSDDDRNSFRP